MNKFAYSIHRQSLPDLMMIVEFLYIFRLSSVNRQRKAMNDPPNLGERNFRNVPIQTERDFN